MEGESGRQRKIYLAFYRDDVMKSFKDIILLKISHLIVHVFYCSSTHMLSVLFGCSKKGIIQMDNFVVFVETLKVFLTENASFNVPIPTHPAPLCCRLYHHLGASSVEHNTVFLCLKVRPYTA